MYSLTESYKNKNEKSNGNFQYQQELHYSSKDRTILISIVKVAHVRERNISDLRH